MSNWIKHVGATSPVAPHITVEVIFSNGDSEVAFAKDLIWDSSLVDLKFSIDSYRVVTTNTAVNFLESAAVIMRQRGEQYDSPGGERSMGKCVEAFNVITGKNLTESEGWLLMQLLKDVRQWQNAGFHRDSAEDCVAYSALKAEALAKEAVNQGLLK